MDIRLFKIIIPEDRVNHIFRKLLAPESQPERAVLQNWADGFVDRDNKFIQEFQTTFESSMWELYLNAVLRKIGASIDFTSSSPDFICTKDKMDFCIEATIAAPPKGGKPPFGSGAPVIMPKGLEKFNVESTLRICNAFTSKHSKYKNSYSKLPHVKHKPFIIALAPFDRPGSHFSANVPIMTALYGIYHDEQKTIDTGTKQVICTPVTSVIKNGDAKVTVSYFTSEQYSDISAVIYNPLATWGKIRALARNTDLLLKFITTHPSKDGSLNPETRIASNSTYNEHILDGIYVFHNPFAKYPLSIDIFKHSKVAQYYLDANNRLTINMSEDFLISRQVLNVKII